MICEACYRWIPEHEVGGKMLKTRPHEIRSRGAGGEELPANQLQLCLDCHRIYHQRGPVSFTRRFPHLKKRIESALERRRYVWTQNQQLKK
jgi:hypothetical protein